MRSFPSRTDSPTFGSLHRHRPSNWGTTSDNLGSQESSPTAESRGANVRQPFFQRSDSIPVRVAHESRHGSRSSTPESTGSGHSHGSSHSRPHSNGTDSNVDSSREDGTIHEGVEEHPGVASRAGRPTFTASRQPKVHHIPIHVEPRDGSHPVVLTPPAEAANCRAPPDLTRHESPASTGRVAGRTPTVPASNAAPDAPDSREHRQKNEGGNSTAGEDERKSRPIPMAKPQSTSETEVTVTLPVPDKKKKTAVEAVNEVGKDVESLRKCVDQFEGTRGDKQYLYLDEMLTRDLIKLDNICTDGDDELRKSRRAVIVAINGCIQALEAKVAAAEGDMKKEGAGEAATIDGNLVADGLKEGERAPGDDSANAEKMDISREDTNGEKPPETELAGGIPVVQESEARASPERCVDDRSEITTEGASAPVPNVQEPAKSMETDQPGPSENVAATPMETSV